MKKIHVSAPASTMLMGEHAVLFGHKALVCAVDALMHVTLTPRADTQVNISSALKNYSADLQTIIHNTPQIKELSFVLIAIALTKPTQGFDLTITSDFSHTVGLGSSAAVTAATVAALLLYTGVTENLKEKTFDIGLQVIHAVQKRGSGSDLVASVYGGMVGYTKNPKQITPLLENIQNLPNINLYYCGYKTPTPEVLEIVAQKAEKQPELYKDLYQQMHNVTVQAETAITQNNWQALGTCMNDYQDLMRAIGVSDEKIEELIQGTHSLPNTLGAKISGSGLGDCIISLSSPSTEQNNSTEQNQVIQNLNSHLLSQARICAHGIQHHAS